MNKKFSKKQALDLLNGKQVKLKSLKSKAGNNFDAVVELDSDGKVKIVSFVG